MNDAEEHRRLRRSMRDLVALSTLPAVWVGLDPAGIVRSLADALRSTLSLDFIYVRLTDPGGEGVTEVVRGGGPAAADVESVRASLAPVLRADQTESRPTIADPSGDGTLHVAVTRFGVGDGRGVLVAGSCNPDFPTEQDRLLLGVGANQTAIVIQRRRVEGQVNEQREWLRVTLASIGDAVVATDTAGRVTFLNAVAEQLTGWGASEAEGRQLETVFNILNEQTRRTVESPVARVLREGVVVGLANHTILVAKDGTERPIDDSAAPIRDAAGRMLGVVLIFRDVTEQRRTEQQRSVRLAATQALGEAVTVEEAARGILRAVGENLGWDVGFFWSVDRAGDALTCVGGWHRPDRPVGPFEAASCGRTFTRGEGLPGRVWASGEPAWILDMTSEAGFPRLAAAADSGLHSALAYPVVVGDRTLGVIEFFTVRFRDVEPGLLEMMGTVAGSVGQFIERRSAEDDLKRSERELADFFENASVGLHWVGADGTILRANQAELDLLGYDREEYVGRPIAEFHADEDVICDILKRLKAGEKLTEYPARLRCKDGSIKDVLIDSSVMWRGGEFVHTRCFTRDVTERKRAEAALREADRRKDEFLATLAHELRNPLAPVRNALEVLKQVKGDAAVAEDARSMMERQVTHMSRLIDDLMDVSRITRGKLALRRGRVNLSDVVRDAVNVCRGTHAEKRHDLRLHLPLEPLDVHGDPVRLDQIVGNLLNNACKYTDPGGVIEVRAEREGGTAVVTVKDNGIGIAPAMLTQVFEIFTQAQHSPERTGGGLGIGLSLVKGLVELHGGSVSARSDGEGHGSEFMVRLPVLAQPSPRNDLAPPDIGIPPRGAGPRRRILVVDDNQDAARSLAMLLTLEGHQTRTAADGEEAVRQAVDFGPDVILLDIGLPKLDGYDACRAIRRQRPDNQPVVIALTGWGQEDDRRRSREAGFDSHLVKPVDYQSLVALIEALVPTDASSGASAP